MTLNRRSLVFDFCESFLPRANAFRFLIKPTIAVVQRPSPPKNKTPDNIVKPAGGKTVRAKDVFGKNRKNNIEQRPKTVDPINFLLADFISKL